MENYLNQCMSLSDCIVKEIHNLMVANNELTHDFKHVFSYCGQYEQEAVLFDVYFLERNESGTITFSDKPHNNEKVQTRLTANNLTAESLARLLQNLNDEYRATKISQLRDLIIEKASGDITFDGSFDFTGTSNEDGQIIERANCKLTGLKVADGDLIIADTWDGNSYTNSVCDLSDNELDRLIEFVKKRVEIVDISLTQEQEEAVEELKKAFQKLADLDVAFIYDCDYGTLQFLNKENIEDYEIEHHNVACRDKGYINVQNQLDEGQAIGGIEYYNSLSNEELTVKPKS